jgi:hypothetical protein
VTGGISPRNGYREIILTPTRCGTSSAFFASAPIAYCGERLNFPEKVSSLFHVDKNRDRLKEILIRFLVSLDAFTDDELAIELRRIRQTADSSPRNPDIPDDGYELSREDRYSCARFVKDLAEANSPYVQH